MNLDLSDPLIAGVLFAAVLCVLGAAWLAIELIASIRRRRFLKLLDQRLSHGSHGDRPALPENFKFKLLHARKDAAR